jgi:hypothetical protein
MALKTCPVCHTRLEYAGQPGDYGFDQKCPKCDITHDCGTWEDIKKEMDANKAKRVAKEILRSDHPKTCKFCIVAATKFLIVGDDGIYGCAVGDKTVHSSDPGCQFHISYIPPFQNCSNCRQGMNRLLGNKETHGCKASVCFPSENQWNSYVSCEKFDPKATVLKEAYEYYKAKSRMLERM